VAFYVDSEQKLKCYLKSYTKYIIVAYIFRRLEHLEMKAILILAVSLLLIITICDRSSDAQTPKQEIEALKQQVQEIQEQNQKMIEEIQKRSQAQIEELRRKIEELEASRESDKQKIEDLETGKGVDEKKLEDIVTKKLDYLSPLLRRIKFNTDFPSYYRTRGYVFKDATFAGAVPGQDDDIFFVDSRLLLSPMIEISDDLSLRSQLDIAKNIIWGGLGDASVSGKFFEAPSPGDSFRGSILREVTDTFTGKVLSPVNTDIDLVDIRSLYMVAGVPIGGTKVGELWVGRQPFDWGLGILNNAGSMPDQDFGSIVDRFEFDTTPFALIDKRWENLLFSIVIDRLSQGKTIANGADGKGWEVGFGSLFQGENLELGGYVFLLNQNGFDVSSGLTGDLDNTVSWSLYTKYKFDRFFAAFEFQDLFGKVNNLEQPLPLILGNDAIDISPENFLLAARVGYDPAPSFIDLVVAEFGWASGDDAKTPDKLEGSAIFFNNAYTADNLLFKHMMPNIYAVEGSVINSGYVRAWTTVKLLDRVYFTPQALFAWVDKTDALSLDPVTPLPKVNRFLGTELEGTLTWKILDHLWFDLIGSVVISGDGLQDLLSQRAFIEGVVPSIGAADPPKAPFAIQGRFVFTLDSIIKTWSGSSSLRQRAWFHEEEL
jgi:hypothetical protein